MTLPDETLDRVVSLVRGWSVAEPSDVHLKDLRKQLRAILQPEPDPIAQLDAQRIEKARDRITEAIDVAIAHLPENTGRSAVVGGLTDANYWLGRVGMNSEP